MMNKSILIINTPKTCNKCPMKTTNFGFIDKKMKVGCKLKGDRLNDVFSNRPNWCPLKPLPNKYELTTEKGNRYAVGWNDCIDEILEDEKMSKLITLSDNDENVKHISSDKNCLWYKGQQYLSLSRYKESTEKYLNLIKQQEKEIKDCKDKISILTSYIKILGENE